jgi:4-hydroxy-2-oxoglutarate aldolase
VSLELNGIFAPVVTNFVGAVGEIDAAAFGRNIRSHIDSGLHGIVVAGSTGEAAFLDEAERSSLTEIAREATPAGKLVIVGCGAESTRATIRLVKGAAARGSDAALVVAPHYYGGAMTPAALLAHYRAVADASPIPILLYNIPKYMHFSLPVPTVAELASHGNIVGIKDSSGNRDILAGFLGLRGPRFHVLVGGGALLQFAMERGASGGILGVSLFAAGLALEVFGAMRRSDAASATVAQERLSPLHTRIVAELGVPGVKAALDAVGLHGGSPRSPLMPAGKAERDEIATLLKSAELVAA